MSGTQRLPGGERRKASQRHSRPAAPLQPLISRLWHPGDRVRWRDRIGVFRRDVGDSEHAEIVIACAEPGWPRYQRRVTAQQVAPLGSRACDTKARQAKPVASTASAPFNMNASGRTETRLKPAHLLMPVRASSHELHSDVPSR